MRWSDQIVRLAFAGGLSFVGVVFVAVALLAAPAKAQDVRAVQQRACGHDVSRHCRRYIREGDMAVYQCLQANREHLSASCRRIVDSH